MDSVAYEMQKSTVGTLYAKALNMQNTLMEADSKDLYVLFYFFFYLIYFFFFTFRRNDKIFDKFSVQCAAFKQEMRHELNHYVLLPSGYDKTIDSMYYILIRIYSFLNLLFLAPELLRTLKLTQISKQNENQQKNIDQQFKDDTPESRMEKLDECITKHNSLIISTEKIFNQESGTIKKQLETKSVPQHLNPNDIIHKMLGVIPVAPVVQLETSSPILSNPSPLHTPSSMDHSKSNIQQRVPMPAPPQQISVPQPTQPFKFNPPFGSSGNRLLFLFISFYFDFFISDFILLLLIRR